MSRYSFTSGSADEAWDALSRMYSRVQPAATSPDAQLRSTTVATSDIAVDRLWMYTAQGAFDASPDQITITSVVNGRISLDLGRGAQLSEVTGDCYLLLPDSAGDLTWEDFGADAVRLPRALVDRTAIELTGIDPGTFQFTSPRPLTPAHARLWLRTATMLREQLGLLDGPADRALVHHELVRTAVAVAVSVFPNTATARGHVPGPGDVRPPAVRRATAYIDTHAFLPITVTDIAEAAGTTPRAIRAAFRRHLDTTPTAYLRRARLDAAHTDLHRARPTDTVDTVGRRWGFTDTARFTDAYTDTYGTQPEVPTGPPAADRDRT